MYKIQTLNNISSKGLDLLPRDKYEVASEFTSPDGILVRSQKMHDMDIPASLLAVGRAGAGVNNIPLDKMSAAGTVVFNAPGANANAVKELVVAGMLMACRNISQAIDYVDALNETDEELHKKVEAGKKQYVGYELPGKTLGIIGLGAIGVQIANVAVALGMDVIGFDPGLTLQSAWKMSSSVKQATSVDEVLNKSDFISFHVPLIEATKGLINEQRLASLKKGVVVLNFARDGIVDDAAAVKGLEDGIIHAYVCDFPSNILKGKKGVIAMPHLGASTGEAEENCAIMVANQIKDYLENGNVVNSVNFPNLSLPRGSDYRVTVVNQNQPNMVSKISHVLGQSDINIMHMANESRGDVAYTIMDVNRYLSDDEIKELSSIDGVLKIRCLGQ